MVRTLKVVKNGQRERMAIHVGMNTVAWRAGDVARLTSVPDCGRPERPLLPCVHVGRNGVSG